MILLSASLDTVDAKRMSHPVVGEVHASAWFPLRPSSYQLSHTTKQEATEQRPTWPDRCDSKDSCQEEPTIGKEHFLMGNGYLKPTATSDC